MLIGYHIFFPSEVVEDKLVASLQSKHNLYEESSLIDKNATLDDDPGSGSMFGL